MSDQIEDVGVLFSVDDSLERIPTEYINQQIERNEKEAIYKAVKQVKENWICIKVKTEKRKNYMFNRLEYFTKVYCRPVQTECIYIPIFEEKNTDVKHIENRMPKDVYFCEYCGGYTKNDSIGNCAACGAGRLYKNRMSKNDK